MSSVSRTGNRRWSSSAGTVTSGAGVWGTPTVSADLELGGRGGGKLMGVAHYSTFISLCEGHLLIGPRALQNPGPLQKDSKNPKTWKNLNLIHGFYGGGGGTILHDQNLCGQKSWGENFVRIKKICRFTSDFGAKAENFRKSFWKIKFKTLLRIFIQMCSIHVFFGSERQYAWAADPRLKTSFQTGWRVHFLAVDRRSFGGASVPTAMAT